jgi:ATP-dependent protease ClpP protease subunit
LSKFSWSSFQKSNSFYLLEDTIAVLLGNIQRGDHTALNNWLATLRNDQLPGTLIVDSNGGISDINTLYNIVKTPLHIHVYNKAGSFAALMCIVASRLTASEKATFMLHASRWTDSKWATEMAESDEIMQRYLYGKAAILSSCIPPDFKEEVTAALNSDKDVVFTADEWYNGSLVDLIGDFEPPLEDDEVATWLKRRFNDI